MKNAAVWGALALTGIATAAVASRRAAAQDDTASRIALEEVATGFAAPLALAPLPGGEGELLIADQVGIIHRVTADGRVQERPFLDLRDRVIELRPSYDERGLLGLALHPEFARNGRFFVYYSAPLQEGAPARFDHTSRLSEFRVSADDPERAAPDSERVILTIDQPQANHNGGQIIFGPDGHLYIGLGDGGAAGDTGPGHPPDWYQANDGGNGQSLETPLGAILRIDVEGATPYAIPDDNPFARTPGARGEIWAYGFRNPFRFSFDRGGAHRLFAGDVGQTLWEELDLVERGGNYGWNVKEGRDCFDARNHDEPLRDCPATDARGQPLLDPVLQYPHARREGGVGTSIIGGYVYRGRALPALQGRYVFGDWSAGDAGVLLVTAPPAREGEPWRVGELGVEGGLDGYVLSFGEDKDGELYVLTSRRRGPTGDTGAVYRLVPAR